MGLPGNKRGLLTPKQKKYLEARLKGMSQPQAVKAAYDTKTENVRTLTNHAQQIEKAPGVITILQAMNNKAQQSLERVLDASTSFAEEGGRDGAAYAGVAVQAANSVLDRLHGKSVQQVNVNSKSVSLNIDLTLDDDSNG